MRLVMCTPVDHARYAPRSTRDMLARHFAQAVASDSLRTRDRSTTPPEAFVMQIKSTQEKGPPAELRKPRRIVVARGLDTALSAPQLVAAIRSGDWPSDLQFDAFLPAEVRAASNKYWT